MRLITIKNVNRLTALIPFDVFGMVRRQKYPFKRAGFHNEGFQTGSRYQLLLNWSPKSDCCCYLFFVCFRLGSIDGRELSVNRPITFQILLDRVSSCRLFHRPFPRQLPKKTPITVGKRIIFCNCYKPACKSFKKGGQNLFSYQQ